MKIIAQFSQARSATNACEDRLLISDSHVMLVDGATQKHAWMENRTRTSSPGAMAASRLIDVAADLSEALELEDIIARLAGSLSEWAGRQDAPTASAIGYLPRLRMIWVVGSGVFSVDGRVTSLHPRHERGAAEVRSAFLKSLLREGKSLQFLRETDPGRELILPLLQRESYLRNVDLDGPWYFGGFDGRPIPSRHIHAFQVTHSARELILASDGYPVLEADLEQTEMRLQGLIRQDPLMIDEYPQTKGVALGDISFDDRTFVHLQL